MPPILRFWRGLAEVAALRRRVRVVARRVYIVGVFVELLWLLLVRGAGWVDSADEDRVVSMISTMAVSQMRVRCSHSVSVFSP
jgi:hypothetical protein